ncbi:hypothetical protein SAMN05444392_11129 [Seinonella peptonophila]|uniref:Uncharacterized protein n=1 Tax=Seinonella peptonophila TaxID=112248 RepID=A0A1M4ZXC5_9BACL|nr:hypothetical protein [Seinonella peptonophila]SHF22635.1 hypothetical protein SAMN05444392_11129 [Seinonella peptonophila]
MTREKKEFIISQIREEMKDAVSFTRNLSEQWDHGGKDDDDKK